MNLVLADALRAVSGVLMVTGNAMVWVEIAGNPRRKPLRAGIGRS